MRAYKIAAIPGDGIGKEVIAEGIKVLNVRPRAIETVAANWIFTPDPGGSARTADVARAVCGFLRQ